MYQLNPASLDSDNNKSESLYKKSNNKTYKNKKSVNFDTSSDEPIKTKINNVTNILSKLHSSNEEEEDNTNFQDNLLQQKSKNFENSMSNVNIINNELNKMNSIDTNTINNTMYNNNKMNNSYSNLDDSYKSNYDFTNTNQQNGILSNNKELLGKLDYIVHLLEEQHNEKTNHITEELILYLFLGIFIIFVLDSFARSSKYTR
tara:strand:+ start:9832 stop:10440 length:609 start_codon:yes stop_codon:yes gene_type:complete